MKLPGLQSNRIWKSRPFADEHSMNFLALSLRLWSGLDVFQPQCGRRNPNAIALAGADGLYDHWPGKLANKRVPTDTVMEMLELFDTRYRDYTPKHFHGKPVAQHGVTRSYNRVRLTLQSHGRVQSAPRRGAHRRKRAPRPMVGMMLHRDGSSLEWVPGQWWDPTVTMDDADSGIYPAFFVQEEGTTTSN